MLNVACLHPRYFSAILAGRKGTEWRRRKRVDPHLEAVAIGEPVLLLECGSRRAIRARVRAKLRFDYLDGYVYAIRLAEVRPSTSDRTHRQGWQRV